MVNCICDQISFITSKCETQSGKKNEKCRILHPIHNLRKKRAKKTPVAQTDYSKVTFHTTLRAEALRSSQISHLSRKIEGPLLAGQFHTITSSVSLVTSCQLCLAFQHLIQIGLITNCVRNQPIKNADICPCNSAGFEHDIVHYFADAIYRRVRASATQAIEIQASQVKRKISSLKVNKATARIIFTQDC